MGDGCGGRVVGIRYRRGASTVPNCHSVQKTGFSCTEGKFGAKNWLLVYGASSSFQRSTAPETIFWCTERTSEVFGDRNALVVCEVKRRMQPLRSGARFEDADGCSYNAAAVSPGDCCGK